MCILLIIRLNTVDPDGRTDNYNLKAKLVQHIEDKINERKLPHRPLGQYLRKNIFMLHLSPTPLSRAEVAPGHSRAALTLLSGRPVPWPEYHAWHTTLKCKIKSFTVP